MLARFGCDHGKLTGALQPVLKNGNIQAIGPDLGKKLEASLADTGVEVLSDRVPGRNAISTIIPIHGNLNRPKLDAWTAITGVLRNAFVVGLRESLQQLPRADSRRRRIQPRPFPAKGQMTCDSTSPSWSA